MFARSVPNILAIKPVQLLESKYGVCLSNTLKRKKIDQLPPAKHLAIIPRRPSEKGQEVEEGIGQVAHFGISHDRSCAMAFRKALLIGSQDERQMSKLGEGSAGRLVQENLFWRIGDVVCAADHMRNPHIQVVGHNSQVIRGNSVGSQQNEIFQVLILDLDRAENQIMIRGVSPGGRENV